LYEYLRAIEDVYLSPVKEPRYFCAAEEPPGYAPPAIRSEAEYLKLFDQARDESAVGEASPQYLCDSAAPASIHAAVPEARIIMILRDPVDRAYSHYLLHQRMGVQQRPAAAGLRDELYLRHGLYAGPVKSYQRLFGGSRVKILVFDDLIRDTRSAVREVLRFLGIDAEPASTSVIHNAYGRPRGPIRSLIYQNMMLKTVGRRFFSDRLRRKAREEIFLGKDAKPPLPQETRTFLEEFYRADVLELEEILGRGLPWFHARTGRRAP